MKVCFNTDIKNNYSLSYGKSKNKSDVLYTTPTKEEILEKKTKKAVSKCVSVVIAVGIMYFAVKRCFKLNRFKVHDAKLDNLSKLQVPVSNIPDNMKTEDFIGRLI